MTDQPIRAFIALETPPALRAEIASLMGSLRPKATGLRWLSPETVHLTLRFLGDSTAEQIARIQPALAAAAAACPATEVHVARLGTFPDRGSPRVLWLGTELPDALLTLQRACETAAVRAGFPREDRPFRSHITLGRSRDRARRPDLPGIDLGRVTFESLVLFKSQLDPKSAIHTPLASLPLGS